MRNTHVKQSRIPHSFEDLCVDCNIKIECVYCTLSKKQCNPELDRCILMFILFLQGKTYKELSSVFNVTRYNVRKSITYAYRWFCKECSVCS